MANYIVVGFSIRYTEVIVFLAVIYELYVVM